MEERCGQPFCSVALRKFISHRRIPDVLHIILHTFETRVCDSAHVFAKLCLVKNVFILVFGCFKFSCESIAGIVLVFISSAKGSSRKFSTRGLISAGRNILRLLIRFLTLVFNTRQWGQIAMKKLRNYRQSNP